MLCEVTMSAHVPGNCPTSVAAELPPRSRETKRLTIGRLILCVAKMRARGHQKLSIFLIVASPCIEKWRMRFATGQTQNGEDDD